MGSVSGTLADSARSYLKDRLYIILKGICYDIEPRGLEGPGGQGSLDLWSDCPACTAQIYAHISEPTSTLAHTLKNTHHTLLPAGCRFRWEISTLKHTHRHTRQEDLDQGCQTPGPRIVPAKTSNWRASVNVKEGTHFQHLTVFS